MWRNGRRNGLKIRSRESGVWVRIPSSAPSKISILLGKLVRARDFVDCERSRTKTHEMTVYLPSVRQVGPLVKRQSRGLIIREEPFALIFTVSHSIADARYFCNSAFATRCRELRSLQRNLLDRRKMSKLTSARTTKPFPSSRCASAIQIVRPSPSAAETQPQLHPALLRLSAMVSHYFIRDGTHYHGLVGLESPRGTVARELTA